MSAADERGRRDTPRGNSGPRTARTATLGRVRERDATRAVLLVGAGHVHRALLAHADGLHARGVALHVIDSGSFWYGGALTAALTGERDDASLRRSTGALARAAGVRCSLDRAVGLERRHRRLWLAGGRMLDYHAVSLNIGRADGLTKLGVLADASLPQCWSGHAVADTLRLRDVLAASAIAGRGALTVIAGGGRRAIEIAAGLSLLGYAVTLLAPGSRLLNEAPVGAGRAAARCLTGRGVDIVYDAVVAARAEHAVVTRDRRYFRADHLVMAVDAGPAMFAYATNLAVDERGLCVGPRLSAPNDARIFAAGGCAGLRDARALSPIDARAQAAVIAHNLLAVGTRRSYRRYRPRVKLSGIDFGGARALVWYRRWWREGRLAMKLYRRRFSA